jgi:hypothetical protein
MTDWYYGLLARRLACIGARDSTAKNACLAQMMDQPIVERVQAVDLQAVRRMDESTNGFAGYLSRLFPPASLQQSDVPLFMLVAD